MNKVVKNKNAKIQPRSELGTFKAAGEARGTPISVALPLTIDQVVRELENRSEWLRRVIVEAAQRELIGNDNTH
jgi:hypothetical protein